MKAVEGLRYVVPLREGGSLPAIVDADDDHAYVVKFRGAGQGVRALAAELIAAELALSLGLPVPRPAIVYLQSGFGDGEPDPEIQDVLKASVGTNFGLEFLPGAFGFDPAVDRNAGPELAANIVWFDCLVTNVDRTPRNPNILVWNSGIWLIDHGATLYFHHGWSNWRERSLNPFPMIQDHVLLSLAGDLRDADSRLRALVNDEVVGAIVELVPDDWLVPVDHLPSPAEQREAYVTWFRERLSASRAWLDEAIAAKGRGPVQLAPRETHRVV